MNSFSESIILIPTLNEKENLEILLPAIFKFMPGISVLVIDDGSKDDTERLIKNLQIDFNRLFILERGRRLGYGTAVLDGFNWALSRSFPFILTMDGDRSHDFKSAPQILNDLKVNDAVIGSRYVKAGRIENWELSRRLLSRFANFYVRLILNLPFHDVTSGFNGYRAEALREIDLNAIKSNGYAFLVELKYKIFKRGLAISECPIVFSERQEGQSKMSKKVIWESIWLPWRLKFSLQK